MFGEQIFIPDQLIAGDAPLISDSVVIAGSAVLQRGTVLGLSSMGAVTGVGGKTFGTGSIIVAGIPSPGDTVTVQGTVITFQAIPTGQPSIPAVGNTVTIPLNATTATVAAALQAFLEGSTDANISKMNYSLAGSTITITSKIPGVGGNAYTLATSNATAFTVSGATLAGGTANAGAETIGSLSAGPNVEPGVYQVLLQSATAGIVLAPDGEQLGPFTVGTPFVSSQINFNITTGSGIAAGDAFSVVAAPQASAIYKLCVASAGDGSDNPAAILADYCDPTAGNVTAGIYLAGEFNSRALIFDPSLSLAGIKASFRPMGIFVKTSVPADPPR
jgi:hypothetical protein